jgi:hypothetical protein
MAKLEPSDLSRLVELETTQRHILDSIASIRKDLDELRKLDSRLSTLEGVDKERRDNLNTEPLKDQTLWLKLGFILAVALGILGFLGYHPSL